MEENGIGEIRFRGFRGGVSSVGYVLGFLVSLMKTSMDDWNPQMILDGLNG